MTTGLFKICSVSANSTDRPLRLEVENAGNGESDGDVAEKVASTVKDRLNTKVVVEVVPAGTYQSPASRKPVLIERL